MRTGGLMEVAVVLKSLLAVHQHKPLSFREKKMLERARYLLVSEVAIARECEELQVEQLLGDALAKSQLRLPDADELKT
jgi:CarD family transcriptional regulator